MRKDVGSNYTLAEAIASESHNAGTVDSASIDHADGDTGSFFLSAGTIGASGTVDAKLQHSADNSAWVDDDGASGNDTAITQITAAGSAQLNVPAPQARYSRIRMVVAVAACVVGITSVLGPLRHVAAE